LEVEVLAESSQTVPKEVCCVEVQANLDKDAIKQYTNGSEKVEVGTSTVEVGTSTVEAPCEIVQALESPEESEPVSIRSKKN
jgi:hypothetical protein